MAFVSTRGQCLEVGDFIPQFEHFFAGDFLLAVRQIAACHVSGSSHRSSLDDLLYIYTQLVSLSSGSLS